MNKDVEYFGNIEIQKINNLDCMKWKIELQDTNKEIEGKHVVNIIWRDLNGNKILLEELFEPMVNPYLYGVKSTLAIIFGEV